MTTKQQQQQQQTTTDDCIPGAFAAASVQAGQVMVDAQHADLHRGQNGQRHRQPGHRALDRRLHLRRHGPAALRGEIRRFQKHHHVPGRGWGDSQVEFQVRKGLGERRKGQWLRVSFGVGLWFGSGGEEGIEWG